MSVELEHETAVPSWWRRWLVTPILTQLRQGITPEKLALTVSLAVTLGLFPIMGATTLLCTLAGFLLKLNQPVLQLLNYAIYPLQIALIFFFIRVGEHLWQARPLAFSLGEMLAKFRSSPSHFFSEFAMTFVHAISAWMVMAPVCAAGLYYGLRPVLRRAARRG